MHYDFILVHTSIYVHTERNSIYLSKLIAVKNVCAILGEHLLNIIALYTFV